MKSFASLFMILVLAGASLLIRSGNSESIAANLPPVAVDMVLVKGGTFEMGSSKREYDIKPQHTVTLDDFYIGKYEITQQQFVNLMGDHRSKYSGPTNPVETVTWREAVQFCNKLSEQEGFTKVYTWTGSGYSIDWTADGYRLPTEAEWEFAARGGTKSKGYTYSGSNTSSDVAWHSGNSGKTPQPVGTKSPNELGIYDMSGNIWELVNDWYLAEYYYDSPKVNPRGPATGEKHVARGGSFNYPDVYCRCMDRFYLGETFIDENMGFRIARSTK